MISSVIDASKVGVNKAGLDIQDGAAAIFAFAQMIDPGTDEGQGRMIRQALLKYCGQDTLAMVRLLSVAFTKQPGLVEDIIAVNGIPLGWGCRPYSPRLPGSSTVSRH